MKNYRIAIASLLLLVMAACNPTEITSVARDVDCGGNTQGSGC